eukprot:Nk52_evm7s554 gene=Nk52_evmTU7s554
MGCNSSKEAVQVNNNSAPEENSNSNNTKSIENTEQEKPAKDQETSTVETPHPAPINVTSNNINTGQENTSNMQTEEYNPPADASSRQRRRTAVSAEPLHIKPSKVLEMKQVKSKVAKSDADVSLLRNALKNNLLFSQMDDDSIQECIDVMEEVQITNGDTPITQGDEVANYYYIVKEGTFDCFVDGSKVCSYGPGDSFGELALMYNAPRAATVTATSDGLMFSVDRETFHIMVCSSALDKRKNYEDFLVHVPLLEPLDKYDRVRLSDVLQPEVFKDGQVIIHQGDKGDKFYLIEKGEVKISYPKNPDIDDSKIPLLGKGQHFGEYSLITAKPRSATVTAVGDVKLASITSDAFTRMLGNCKELLMKDIEKYKHFIEEAEDEKQVFT